MILERLSRGSIVGSRAASLVDDAAPAFVIFGAAVLNARDSAGVKARAVSLLKRILAKIGLSVNVNVIVIFLR